MKRVVLFLFIIIVFFSTINAQSIASVSGAASANLIVPLSITPLSGNIDFGEIILMGTPSVESLTPDMGKLFGVNGHPGRSVTVTFNPIIIDNFQWVAISGGTNGTMNFTPIVTHTGSSSSYVNPTVVASGSSYQLLNVGGEGQLYVWVGGSISIAANQPYGDYTGLFAITVIY